MLSKLTSYFNPIKAFFVDSFYKLVRKRQERYATFDLDPPEITYEVLARTEEEMNFRPWHLLNKVASMGACFSWALSSFRRTHTCRPRLRDVREKCSCDVGDCEFSVRNTMLCGVQVEIHTPAGELMLMNLMHLNSSIQYSAARRGTCGRGIWVIRVMKHTNRGPVEVDRLEMFLSGVGTIYYRIDKKHKLVQEGADFLNVPYCRRHDKSPTSF